MAESSSQNPSSPNLTPKEERVTLDKPEIPNPFLPAIQEAFIRAPNQYKEYLSEFWNTTKVLPDSKIWVSTPTGEVRGEIGITTFRNALRAQYLPHSSMYVPPPSITTIRPWFATIGYNGEIREKELSKREDLIHKLNKKTRENIVPYSRFISLLLEHMAPKYDNEELTINPTQVFSVYNWILKPNQLEEPPFIDHMKAICNLDVHVDSKAPKYFSPTEKVPQGKKPGARNGLRRKQSSKHTSESTTEASKS
ncbi:hypothetical protein Tco_1430298 [Tanacetum coccineum]